MGTRKNKVSFCSRIHRVQSNLIPGEFLDIGLSRHAALAHPNVWDPRQMGFGATLASSVRRFLGSRMGTLRPENQSARGLILIQPDPWDVPRHSLVDARRASSFQCLGLLPEGLRRRVGPIRTLTEARFPASGQDAGDALILEGGRVFLEAETARSKVGRLSPYGLNAPFFRKPLSA